MTDLSRTRRDSARQLQLAWLDENDLTPPPGDHSLDAHQAQHRPRAEGAVRRGLDALRLARIARAGSAGPTILRAIVGEEIVGRGLDDPGPYSMLEVLTPTMIDYARPELAAEMVPRLLSGQRILVPGLLRTRLGQRSGVADDARRAARRRLGDQRPEGVDELRAVRAPGACCSPVPARRTPRITKPSPRSSSTWTPPESRCARCAPCTASTSSARSTSTTWWCPPTACSASPATAGGWRWICCPTNARPASGSASPTCTRDSTR